ncbi:unannotated protein [freshwater metagenome]|uniref:Unannotated protein n=1 Tax=freshwater metagenome TaxID=449393 RepID=A0A6J6ZDX0_9ZZZZ
MRLRLIAYAVDGSPRLFATTDEGILDLGEGGLTTVLPRGLDDLPSVLAAASQALPRGGPPAGAILLAPISSPSKMLFVGLNYRDHLQELPLSVQLGFSTTEPAVFSKLPSAIIGPGAAIVIPSEVESTVDYEGELAIVIGRRGRHLTKENALNHVLGYTVANDVSDRGLQFDGVGQLTIGKGLDTFCPLGPALVLKDEIPDPTGLRIRTTVNGVIRQESNTENMTFSVVDILVFITKFITLEVGDIVSTGTPGGVGFIKNPPEFLRPGDEVVVEVEMIGQLSNPVVSAGAIK